MRNRKAVGIPSCVRARLFGNGRAVGIPSCARARLYPAAIIAGLTLAVSACQEPLTQIVVLIESDLMVPDDVDRLVVMVDGPSGARTERAAALTRAGDLPQTVTLVPGGDATGPITVSAAGQRNAADVVRRWARTRFASGQSVTLKLFLSRSCAGAAPCGSQDESCTEIGCRPAEVAPEALPRWPLGADCGRLGQSCCPDQKLCTEMGSACRGGVCACQTCTRIKDINFEQGRLIDPVTGIDRANGKVSLETAAPLKGKASAALEPVPATFLTQAFAAVDDLYVSFYLRATSVPTSSVRLLNVQGAAPSGRISMGSLWLDPAGDGATLRLVFDAMIPPVAPVRIALGMTYRLGLRQRRGAGADGIIEGYVAAGDGPFGAAFAKRTNGPWTAQVESMTLGSTAGGALGLVLDDIRIDAGAMPPPSRP